MSETRADTTSMGLFVISFLMLVLTLVGILNYTESEWANGITTAAVPVATIATIAFAYITHTMWKANNKFVMIIFGLLTVFHFVFILEGLTTVGEADANFTGYALVYVVVFIFFLILALVTLLKKAGYLLTLLLITAGLVFLSNGLATLVGGDIYFLLLGIFALLSFILSTWLALADNTEIGLRVV